MKFVSDSLTTSRISDDGQHHTVRIPIYHRAAVGIFPGTRLFAVPLTSTNEIVLTPIDPAKWGDLWRLEATVSDRPGSAKKLVETLVENDVNVLVHEGVSESVDQGNTVHQIFEILDLAKYADKIDGTTEERNSLLKPLLRPNRLINSLASNAATSLAQTRGRDAWEMQFARMEFFFNNKEARDRAVELARDLSLNVDNEVHVPTSLLRDMSFITSADAPLVFHIISDTEQKYVKLRALSSKHFYLILEIEHAEQVGAIDAVMRVLESHDANMIDSYSRLKSISKSALFNALVEFSGRMTPSAIQGILKELSSADLAQAVTLKGASGDGPDLDRLKLPAGVTVRQPRSVRYVALTEADEPPAPQVKTKPAAESTTGTAELGQPYYLNRFEGATWTRNTAEVFMAVPFAKSYLPFYKRHVASAVSEAGLEPVRVDQLPAQARRRPIIERIEEGIARARFVVADVSGWNANVIYEVGLAVGICKPLLLLCNDEHFTHNEVPFDFLSYEHILYSTYNPREFKRQLTIKIDEMKDATAEPLVEGGAAKGGR